MKFQIATVIKNRRYHQ